ncbi:MAG TPA: hypothetical protein VF621_00635, partial [Pyrinomonadaceae bacterium]|jgi:hypothetical protein
VSDDTLPPHTVFVAADGERALRPRFARGFGELVASEPVALRDVGQAIRYVTFFLSVTQPDAEVVESISDIPGVTEAERGQWESRLGPPAARAHDSSFEVEMWLWSGPLSRGRFAVARGGKIEPRLDVVTPKVGVKITIE